MVSKFENVYSSESAGQCEYMDSSFGGFGRKLLRQSGDVVCLCIYVYINVVESNIFFCLVLCIVKLCQVKSCRLILLI